MAADPPRADFWIAWSLPEGGSGHVGACAAHRAHTEAMLAAQGMTVRAEAVRPDDPRLLGCKGHLESWPAS